MDLQIKNFHLQHSVVQIEKLAAILIIYAENNITALIQSMLFVTNYIRRNEDQIQLCQRM